MGTHLYLRRSAANARPTRLADFIGRWLTMSYKTDFWSEDGTINYLLYEYLMETIELFPDDKSPGSPYKRLKDQLPKLAQDTPPSPKQATDRKKLKDSKGMRHTFSDLISKKLPRPEDIKFVDLHGTHARPSSLRIFAHTSLPSGRHIGAPDVHRL